MTVNGERQEFRLEWVGVGGLLRGQTGPEPSQPQAGGSGGQGVTLGGASSLPGFTSPTLGAWALTFLLAPRAAAPVVRDAPRRQGAGLGGQCACAQYTRVSIGCVQLWRGVPLCEYRKLCWQGCAF